MSKHYNSKIDPEQITDVLLDNSLNPETKVYLIANCLHDLGKIDSTLWYAILELKDKHLKDIQIEYDIDYFNN